MIARDVRFHIRKFARMKGKKCRENRERERERERRVAGRDCQPTVVSPVVAPLVVTSSVVVPSALVSPTMRMVASWV